MDKWYRATLAVAKSYIGRPPTVWVRRAPIGDERTLMVDLNRGRWLVVLRRELAVAMIESYEEETRPAVLKQLEG